MNMGPIVQQQCVNLFCLIVLRKVNGFLLSESDIIFVLKQVYLLRIIHDEHALNTTFLFHVVLDALTIWFKNGKLSTS